MVGSRFGLTRVDGDNVYLHAGSGADDAYLMLGFRAFNQDALYHVTGAISITATSNVSGVGGSDIQGYVQVGHGGANPADSLGGTMNGEVQIIAGNNIEFTSGTGKLAYVKVGNGGWRNQGTFGGNHTLHAVAGDIRLSATVVDAFAQIGNGSETSNLASPTSGNLTVTAGGNIFLHGGTGTGTYVMVGNGGNYAPGNHTGDHVVTAQNGEIQLYSGNAEASFAQIGNGGHVAHGTHSGDLTIFASKDISVIANDPPVAYAQIGNGGKQLNGALSGNISLTTLSGNLRILGGHETSSYAQIGLGGYASGGNYVGDIELTIGENLIMEAGGSNFGYVQIGHGDRDTASSGQRRGTITVLAGQDMQLTGAFIGHWSIDKINSLLGGNTWLAVGQNKTSPSGKLQARTLAPYETMFRSSDYIIGGQLRFYVPSLESIDLASGTLTNGGEFPGTVDEGHYGGEYAYPNGTYTYGYTFYVEPQLSQTILFMPLIEP